MSETDAKAAAARRFVDGVVQTQDRLPASVGAAGVRCAQAMPPGHVIFAPGGTSVVALPTNIAIVRAGIAKRFVLASYDRPDSLGDHLGRAFCQWAKEQGCEVAWVQGDAIVAGKDPEVLPEAIQEALVSMGAAEGGVSINESIAFGFPKPAPGSPDMNIGDLLSEGRIRRRKLAAASEADRQHTHRTMGLNPGCYRREMERLGYLRPESFGLSYSWWGSPPNYGIVHEAKRILEEDCQAWFDAHGDTLGRHRVVMQPATPSPALSAITLGPMMAVLSLMVRENAQDHTSFAEMGVVQLYGTLDSGYVHPFLDRDGVLIRLDRTELDGWPWVDEQMQRFESLVPGDLRGRMSDEDSHRLLTQDMGWPADWRRYLEAMTIFETPPQAPEASPLPEAGPSAVVAARLHDPALEPSLLGRADLGLLVAMPALARVLAPVTGELASKALWIADDVCVQEGALPAAHLEISVAADRVESLGASGGVSATLTRHLRHAGGHVARGTTTVLLGVEPQRIEALGDHAEVVGELTVDADFGKALTALVQDADIDGPWTSAAALFATAATAMPLGDGLRRIHTRLHGLPSPGDVLQVHRAAMEGSSSVAVLRATDGVVLARLDVTID